MALKASDVLQFLIAADQLMANATRLVKQFKELEGADDATIKTQLKALEDRNTARYAEISAHLDEIANGG